MIAENQNHGRKNQNQGGEGGEDLRPRRGHREGSARWWSRRHDRAAWERDLTEQVRSGWGQYSGDPYHQGGHSEATGQEGGQAFLGGDEAPALCAVHG